MYEKNRESQKDKTEILNKNKKFQEIHERFEQKVKYAAIVGLVGVSAYAGLEEYVERQTLEKHENHIQTTLTVEQYQQYLGLKEVVLDIYGQAVVEEIMKGDLAALDAQNENRAEPEFDGFDRDSHLGGNASIQHYPDFIFTESFGMYPQGWLAGEVSSVKIEKGNKARVSGDNVQGASFHPGDDFVVIYDISDTISEDEFNPHSFDKFMQDSFAHETGHANDWQTKIDLNALERFELLHSVTQRMLSEDAFSDKSLADGSDYWRSFDDGTPYGFSVMAKEYWAEIVAAYFTEPDTLQSDYPLDFDLVQEVVRQTDDGFDIFDAERGAYNVMTGQRNEKWSNDFDRLAIKQEEF